MNGELGLDSVPHIYTNELFADRLAGEARELECPLCRRPTAVPEQGFPVCVLTERIKDELKYAREKAESANIEKPTSKGL